MKDFAKKVDGFLADTGMSAAELARSVGLSPAVMSGIRKGTYAGDIESAKTKVVSYIDNYITKETKTHYIETNQVHLVNFVIDKAISERAMAVIYGNAGSGKTTACKAKSDKGANGIYIECDAFLTTRGLFKRITNALGIDGKRSLSETLEVIVAELTHRDTVMYIDEAEYLHYKSLEMLRRIWDFSNTTIIFIGIHDIYHNLKKHPQLYSRIKWKWEIKPMETKEVETLCEAMGIQADEAAIKAILNHTKGNFRSSAYILDIAKGFNGGVVDVLSVNHAKEMLLL